MTKNNGSGAAKFIEIRVRVRSGVTVGSCVLVLSGVRLGLWDCAHDAVSNVYILGG